VVAEAGVGSEGSHRVNKGAVRKRKREREEEEAAEAQAAAGAAQQEQERGLQYSGVRKRK